jgi:tetratricopeptide (TPR) repeat protein
MLRKAVSEAPDNPEANLYLGMALNGLADKEAETYLKRALMLTPDNPATNYELGLVYYQKNIYAEAADYFENTQLLAPGSEYARKSKELIRKMDEKARGKRWEVYFLAGLQYDSNVILNGDTTPLPSGYSGKSDWSGIINLKGHYSFFRSDTFDIRGGYSLYQSLHTKLDNFNVMQNLFGLSCSYTISPKFKIDANYSFEYMLVGGDQYDYAHNLGPALVFKSGDWGTTSIDYRYNNTIFKNSAQFSTNSDRSGDNHLVSLTHILPLGQAVAVWGSYAHDENLARAKNWNYSGDKWQAGVRAVLPFRLMGDLYGEYYQKSYEGVDPSFGTTRDDQQYSVSASLTRNITETISLVLNELYTRNRSNFKTYEYERSITGLFVNVRFYD